MIEKTVKLDTIQMWLNGESNYGLLQTLQTICNDCSRYYADLCQNNVCNSLKSEEMVRYDLNVHNSLKRTIKYILQFLILVVDYN